MHIGDVEDMLEQHISALLSPFTNHEGYHEPPHQGKGHPHSRIAIGLSIESSKRQMVFLGMDKAPELVQLGIR